jgi:endo-1,4-beta-mannosidase
MVGVQNGHFSVNGEPFKHVGANVAQLVYEHPDRVWDELNRLKNAGVKDVRVFLPNSALTPEQVGNHLQVLLDQAQSLGMKATVSLTHFARQEFYTESRPEFLQGGAQAGFQVVKGDERYADEPVYQRNDDGSVKVGQDGKPVLAIGHSVLGDDWLRGGYKENFKPFAEYIVDRFKNHPGVFAWEVANETKSYGTPPDLEAVKGFYSDMVATIRAKDPNHLISAGLTNSREFVGTDENARRAFLAQFDFVSIHQYNADLQGDIDTDIRLAKELGKPIVMGEFGFFPAGGKPRPSMSEVERYVQSLYERGVDAVMPWGAAAVGGERWWDDEFGANGQNEFHDMLRRANSTTERWNAAN